MKKNNNRIILVTIILLISIGLILDVMYPIGKGKLLELVNGEDMVEFSLYSYNNKKISSYELLQNNNDRTVVFYLSSSCGACIELLDTINILVNIFKNHYNYIIIWEDEIPKKRLNKYNMNNEINYCLKNRNRLNGVKPYGFIIDNKDKKVVFETDNFNSIINKIVSKIPENELCNSANKYFYSINLRDTILFFETNDCEECIKVLKKINRVPINIPIININSQNTSTYNKNSLIIYDKYGIYKKIYNVKIYPSMIKIDNKDSSKILNITNFLDSLKKIV